MTGNTSGGQQGATASGFTPITAGDRIVALDVLRGFALLGIFLVNAEWFSRPIQELGTGLTPGLSGIDHVLALGVRVLMEGKFWILFSLLFGMGFALMLERASAVGRPFVAVYLRRIAVLLLFGLAHAWLLWVGDILHSYALAAVLLLLSRNWSATTQLRVGVGGYVGLGLLIGLASLLGDVDASAGPGGVAAAERASAASAVYANGGYARITLQRLRDFQDVLSNDVLTVPVVWLVFLTGAWFVRSGRMRNRHLHRAFFKRLALFALPIGLGLSIASVAVGASFPPGDDNEASFLAMGLLFLGSLPLSLGYLAGDAAARWQRCKPLVMAGAGRAHGADQLPDAVDAMHPCVLRLRPRPLGTDRPRAAVVAGLRDLRVADPAEPVVAGRFPFRTGRMAVALGNLRPSSADAPHLTQHAWIRHANAVAWRLVSLPCASGGGPGWGQFGRCEANFVPNQ